MTTLSRKFDFNSLAGKPIYGNNIDDELDQIVNLLNGTSSNRRGVINYTGSNAPMTLNQLGSGDLFVCQKNGTDTFRIANNGQLRSTVSNGTAPIVVSSNTKVTNLNADLCNGIEGSALVRNDQASQALLGNLRIKKASTGTYDMELEVDADAGNFYRYDGSKDTRDLLFTIANLNSTNKVIAFPGETRLQVLYTPTEDNDVARKMDLTARQTVLAISDIVATPATTRYCGFVAPKECIITAIKGFYLGGTPTGTCALTLFKNGTTTGQSLSILSSATVGQAYNQYLSPQITLSQGDSVYIGTSTGSGHTDMCSVIVGYYTGN